MSLLSRSFLFLILFCPIQTLACPQGYAIVPADNVYTTQDHCLSVYEMKNINGKAVSTFKGEPWHLARYPAGEECQKLGHDLPTNRLWQAMARNAEKQAVNWEDGKMKPSIILSNGAKFYNVGDSVWEQIKGKISTDPQINGLKIEQLDNARNKVFLRMGNSQLRTPKGLFGPAGTYEDAGLGVATTYDGNYYIMRGGDDQDPGLFGVAMNHSPGPDSNSDDVGFRCACPVNTCSK